MKIGTGESDITPPFPCKMAGFGLARQQEHNGVHDPLGARCALFENKGEKLALCSIEVVGIKADIVAQIRAALPGGLDLPPERLVLVCTHTHGGPVIEGDYAAFLIERVVEAVIAAHGDLRERTLGGGIASHKEWIGFNRRRLETGFLPVDREIPFLVVSESDGRPRAVLFHYACHPSILGPDNLLITADWPGYARKVLQEQLGDGVSVFYLKGTEGNINTGYSAGISALGIKIPTRTYRTAERVGKVIARSVLDGLGDAGGFEAPVLACASRQVELAYRPHAELEAYRKRGAWWEKEIDRLEREQNPLHPRIIAAKVERAYAGFTVSALEQIRAEGVASRSVEQTVFRIGEAGFLTFPGEFFVESGLQTKKEAKSRVTFPLGITNDYLGYFPTEAAFAEGGYETACARFAFSSADLWTREGVSFLNKLF